MAAKLDPSQSDSKNILRLAISAACAGIPATQVHAAIEEIIVTSTKREANLQEIPLSVTAFENAEIVRQGFKNFNDFAGQIPNLAVVERQPGATNVLMRGCATQGLSFSDSPTTSVYLDEQPITASGFNPDPRLIDIERVEALGGPQGTLFGDAAQCGTLRIITNKPDTEAFDSFVAAEAMSVKNGDIGYDFSAMANIPLVQDKLALRLVGFVAEEPGFVDNVLSPSPGSDPALGVPPGENFDNAGFVDDDVNTGNFYGGRANLRWNATENWTVDINGIYQKYELDGFAEAALNSTENDINLYSDTSVFPRLDDYDQIRFSSEDWDDEWYQASLTIEGNIGFADLVVTGAYFNRETKYNADATSYLQSFQQFNTYLNNYDPYCVVYGCNIYDFNGDPRGSAFDKRETDSYTLEMRLSSEADSESRWGWLAGAFYNHREVDEFFRANVDSLWDQATGETPAGYYLNYSYYNANPGASALSNNWFVGTYDSELDQWAVFGEMSFDITENFTVTAGGRWYDVDNDYTVVQGALIGLNGNRDPNCAVDFCWTPGFKGEGNDDGFVPKVNFTYRFETGPTDGLVYLTYSEGFRRGGVNSGRPQTIFGPPSGLAFPAGAFNEYDSDEVKNWEIGAKTEWFDNTLRFNITAYTMTWEDIQIQLVDPISASFTNGTINAGDAELNGVETWLTWAPTESWNITGSAGYNDGELTDPFEILGQELIANGTELPLMPDWKASLTAQYTFGSWLFDSTPYVLAQYNYQGDSKNSVGVETTTFDFPVRDQPSWQTVGLRAGMEGESWTAEIYIDNVFDEYQENFFNNRWSQQRLSTGQPRTVGIGFRKSFGKYKPQE